MSTSPETAIAPAEMLKQLQLRGRAAYYIPLTDDIVPAVVSRLNGDEVVVIMSNGSFGGIHDKMLNALRETHASATVEN